MSFLTNNYTYHEGSDPDNQGILIPRYRAVGRMAPNGKRYTAVSRKNEDDLVEVRSIISKVVDKNTVTPDLLSLQNSDFSDGAALGASFGTSITEAITQGALALKHGGHEKKLEKNIYLYAPFDCTYTEEGKWIILKSKTGKKVNKYPRPENFVLCGPTEFSKGDMIGTAYHTVSPITKLNNLIKLFHASSGSTGKRYYEKDNILISECYAYEEGTIHYTENKRGDIEVTIGSHTYNYNPKVLYYFPDGAKVKKRQRFCSGLLNPEALVAALGSDLREIYLIFRSQFYSLQDDSFVQLNEDYIPEITTLSDHTTQEELVETLFISLINVKRDKSNNVDEVEYLGTLGGTLNNDSFYTVLSYGYSGKVISKALKGQIHLADDTMTETVLGLLLNNKLDSK